MICIQRMTSYTHALHESRWTRLWYNSDHRLLFTNYHRDTWRRHLGSQRSADDLSGLELHVSEDLERVREVHPRLLVRRDGLLQRSRTIVEVLGALDLLRDCRLQSVWQQRV